MLPIEDDEIVKQSWTRCEHQINGDCGCSIYKKRPYVCKIFKCGWLLSNLGAHWKPSISGMIINFGVFPTETLGVWVSKESEDLWRKDPFFSELCEIAAQYLLNFRQLTFVYPHGFKKGESDYFAIDHMGREPLRAHPDEAVCFYDNRLFRINTALTERWGLDGATDLFNKGWYVDGTELKCSL